MLHSSRLSRCSGAAGRLSDVLDERQKTLDEVLPILDPKVTTSCYHKTCAKLQNCS